MARRYRVTANLWRDLQGVRHRRGDVVTPPESDIDRLVRAGAIVPLDSEVGSSEVDKAVADGLAEAERIKAWLAAETQWTEEQATKATGATQAPPSQPLVRPKAASTKPLWEAYATARGVDVAGLDKDEIIAAVDALDAK